MLLDSQWLASVSQARNEQQVRLNLEIEEGQYLNIYRDFSSLMYRGIKNDQDYSRRKIAGHLWRMENGTLICQDCTSISGNIDIDNDSLRIKVSNDEADFELSIDEDGFQIKTSDNQLTQLQRGETSLKKEPDMIENTCQKADKYYIYI